MTARNIFKKLILFLLCVSMLSLTFSSCASNESSENEDVQTLIIGGAIYEPYFYLDENGEFAGIDVELAKEACRRMGYEAKFVNIDWLQKDELLDNGTIDCAWACFSMNNRKKDYDWAGPYASDRQVVAVLAKSDIYTLSDLENKSIAVQAKSQPATVLIDKTDDRIPPLKKIYCLENLSEGISALSREYVDACAGHEAAINELLNSDSVDYRLLEEPLLLTQLGVAFKKGENVYKCTVLSDTLIAMVNDGFVKSVFSSYGLYVSEVNTNAYS